ncbi:MAG: polysaccharide pyruvyl transferase family protein [Lachnospiraceae bacterium]|nr:polysaccharide pyruvyl transferase family protein [Lachnospiraceae bacterium]
MIDELQLRYPEAMIYVQRAIGQFKNFPVNQHVNILPTFPAGGKRRAIQERISYLTNGKINLTDAAKQFYKVLFSADIVIHAPGGPSIGDIYLKQEVLKLRRLMIVKKSCVPYVFFAPSMGPFENKKRNKKRKIILENAALISLREEISKQYVDNFVPEKNAIVTLDSAFQHTIDAEKNEFIFQKDIELKEFVGDGSRVVGMTITDLQWNPLYQGDDRTAKKIRDVFTQFVKFLVDRKYRVLFIPQLFDNANDYDYMNSYAVENCCVMKDTYDCYFQQYIISKLKAVVGMRYHSNIFSAKMGTPFVSISYEQKMSGFMEKAELKDYCIEMKDLSFQILKDKFEKLEATYYKYQNELKMKANVFKAESIKTTELVCNIIERNSQKRQ